MKPDSIFQPMAALALLTMAVLTMIAFQRFRARFRGEACFEDFRLGESALVPDRVRLPNRNFMNLLETPVLFYVVCLMFYVTGRVTPASLALAWLYVGLRAAHTLVHLTYNDVLHRFLVYFASNVALFALWTMFFSA